MKIMLAALGFVALGVTAASAQLSPWRKDLYPYEARHHAICQEKAIRLHDYERRAARDGRIDRRERETIEALRRDLDRTCGGWRHRC